MNTAIFRSVTFATILWRILAGLLHFPLSARTSGDEINIEAIEAYATDQMRVDRIPRLALGIVKGDRIVYLKGYGRAGPSGRPRIPT